MVNQKKNTPSHLKFTHTEGANCKIPAKLDYIPLLIEEAFGYFEARGIGEECWHRLNSALSEVLNNAILHGCKDIHNSYIEISWDWTDENIHITVTDPGKGDWDASPELPNDVLSEKGRGLFLINKMADYVQHETSSSGHTVTFRIFAGRKLAERQSSNSLEETLSTMTEELSTSYENLSALFRFAEMLATATSFDHLAKQILDQLIDLLPAINSHLRLVNDQKDLQSICHVGFLPSGTTGKVPISSSFLEAISFKGKNEKCLDDCSKLSLSDPLYSEEKMAFVCPVLFRENILGTLTVQRDISNPFFTAGQMSIIRTVAEFLGIAYTNAQLLLHQKKQERALRDLEIAADIQRSLLPRQFPVSKYFEIYGICESASLVGGDFFDIIEVSPNELFLMIADVMGKSIPAALLSTTLRTAIHARIGMAKSPGKLLSEINRQLFSDLDRVNMFITTQIVYVNSSERILRTANAGHSPLLYLKANSQEIDQIDKSGVPLGIHPDEEYEESFMDMNFEDKFVMITDGLYEVFNAKREMLGFDGLIEKLKHARRLSPKELCQHFIGVVHEYAHYSSPIDDQTMLAFQLKDPSHE